jgi:serine/threonine protein kinase
VIGQTLLGRYRVTGKRGEGGSGTVYEADHLQLGAPVALKVMDGGALGPTEESVKRFVREAQALTRLSHPCAVKVFDQGRTEDGRVWLAMELLQGQTLDERLRERGPLLPGEVVDLFRPLCELLAEAHEKGIVHRDLKPQNIILVPVAGGKVLPKLVDFGIAFLRSDDRVTDPDLVSGTPRYMAPEQWEGLGNADARSDVYSLGVILFEALSGQLPLEADGTLAWLNKHRYQAPRDLREAMAGRSLPEGLRRAVMRAMAKNPGERQQTAMELSHELAAALDAAVAGEDDAAPPPRPVRRSRFVYAARAVAIAGVAPLVKVTRDGSLSPGTSYFPMRFGNWWIYDVTDPKGRTVQKTIMFDGQGDVGGAHEGLRGYLLDRREPAGTGDRWFARRGSEIGFVHDKWYDSKGKFTSEVSFKPYRFRIADAGPHCVEGAKWTEVYDRIEFDLETGKPGAPKKLEEEWTVKAVDEEITVPAGTFRCICLHRRSKTDGQVKDSTYWFAPGVGKVREDSPAVEFEKLLEYHIEPP